MAAWTMTILYHLYTCIISACHLEGEECFGRRRPVQIEAGNLRTLPEAGQSAKGVSYAAASSDELAESSARVCLGVPTVL